MDHWLLTTGKLTRKGTEQGREEANIIDPEVILPAQLTTAQHELRVKNAAPRWLQKVAPPHSPCPLNSAQPTPEGRVF